MLRRIEPEPRDAYVWTAAERALLESLRPVWSRRWPDGMPIASADIVDRAVSADSATLLPEASPLTPREPLTHWSARTALLRSFEGLADQFLPFRDLTRLQRLVADGAVEPAGLETAVNALQQDRNHAALFSAGPIQGPALLQALFAELEANR